MGAPLGTTAQGQDVLALTVAGARPSLSIGFAVGFIVVVLGALYPVCREGAPRTGPSHLPEQ